MITYPVDLNSRWALYLISTASVTETNRQWPRADRGPIERPDPDVIPLLMVRTPYPVIDPATHTCIPGDWIVDLPGNTYTQSWSEVPLSASQLEAIADQVAKAADLVQIKSVALALKNGTGTAAERIARCERVLVRLIKDNYGS